MRRLVLTGAALVALATGCADDTPPGQAVPALADRLERVDAAIEAEDYPQARTALEALVAETAKASVAGRISEEQADRILEAAEAVLARLPDEGSPETPTDEPTQSPPTPDSSESESPPEEDEDKDDEKDEDKNEDKDKDEEKDKGGGNGPDDGHGN